MFYCKRYERKEDINCKKCHEENKFPYDICCLNECNEHEFCKHCKLKRSK